LGWLREAKRDPSFIILWSLHIAWVPPLMKVINEILIAQFCCPTHDINQSNNLQNTQDHCPNFLQFSDNCHKST